MKRIFINNSPTKYLISEEGKIFSEYIHDFLKPYQTQHGYFTVFLRNDGKKIKKYVHRLVAENFLGLQEGDQNKVVNHKDGNKINNCVENLELITPSENLSHAYYNQLKKPNKKKVEKFIAKDFEEWKKINIFSEDYEVSSLGRVKSLKYKTPIILRQDLRCGYPSVTLSYKGKTKHFLVHDLVYAAFCGSLDKENFVIDHIDGNKKNNNKDNLRQITRSENSIVALYEQRTNKSCKQVTAFKNGKVIGNFPSIAKAAESLDIDASAISKVCRGKQKSSKGYTFCYKEKGSTIIS